MAHPLRTTALVLFVWVPVLGLVAPSYARAQQPRHAARGRGSAAVDAAARRIATTDAAEIRAGLEELGVSASPRAVGPIADRIRRGLPPELLDLAIDTLGALGKPEAGPILIELLDHRRASARAKAIAALLACHARGADAALSSALSDPDPRVRGAAATGIGQLGARSSLEPLFVALDRGVYEAATAIAQIAEPAEVPRLVASMSRVPFDAISPALSELLARANVPESAKLDVVARVQALGTVEAKTFLDELLATLPVERPTPLRRAVEAATQRMAR